MRAGRRTPGTEAFQRAMTDCFQVSSAGMGDQLSVLVDARRIALAWAPAASPIAGQHGRGGQPDPVSPRRHGPQSLPRLAGLQQLLAQGFDGCGVQGGASGTDPSLVGRSGRSSSTVTQRLRRCWHGRNRAPKAFRIPLKRSSGGRGVVG